MKTKNNRTAMINPKNINFPSRFDERGKER